MEQSRTLRKQDELGYNLIMAFNLGAGLALLICHHWLGLFNGTVGAAGFLIGIYKRRRGE